MDKRKNNDISYGPLDRNEFLNMPCHFLHQSFCSTSSAMNAYHNNGPKRSVSGNIVSFLFKYSNILLFIMS